MSKRKVGRPVEAVPSAMADEILHAIADGVNLREFCRRPGRPNWRTVYDWMEKDADFAARIARAREVGCDAIAHDALHIADTQLAGEIVKDGPDGTTVTREDMLGHRRLQVDARIKLLSKWMPKKYGDKVGVEHSGQVTLEQLIAGSLKPPGES